MTIAAATAVLIGSPDSSLQARRAPDDTIRCGVDMRNVTLHVAAGIALRVSTLEGELVGHTPGTPPIFDDPSSYTMRLASAEMSMDATSLTALMTRVFSGSSPIRDLKIAIAQGQIKQSGRIRKGIEVPFSMTTTVTATTDGRLRLHATALRAIGIPVKGMLDLFGVGLDTLMKMPGQRGLEIEDDDILLSPAEMLPPPATEGKVKAVRILGDRLVMVMTGTAQPPARPATLPDPAARNYLYFHGGVVRFGKLTMTDADLELVDADPSDPFDFFPDHYQAQLVAGYSRSTARGGLKVMVPDYADLNTTRGRPPLPRVGSQPPAGGSRPER